VPRLHRRDFLKLSLGAIAGSLIPLPVLAAPLIQPETPRSLSFNNIHTGEKLRVCYFDQSRYQPDALCQINTILRDYRTNEMMDIDVNLLDLLYKIQKRTQSTSPFHVISGYRSPKTNDMLRRCTSGVAKSSLHTKGRAIDIRLPQYNTRRLRDVCASLYAGGVGYYAKSDFVHVDTGRVRTWQFTV
jgi:uncharacterized protein YcbK (DUF882 family)